MVVGMSGHKLMVSYVREHLCSIVFFQYIFTYLICTFYQLHLEHVFQLSSMKQTSFSESWLEFLGQYLKIYLRPDSAERHTNLKLVLNKQSCINSNQMLKLTLALMMVY